MNAPMSRRQFFRICATGLGSSSVVGLGLVLGPGHGGCACLQTCADDRNTQHLSLLFGRLRRHHVFAGRQVQERKNRIIHIEGDPDHPTNRGTLCPKGAALLDFVHSAEPRSKYPLVREPGSQVWKPISWDDALDRIAR